LACESDNIEWLKELLANGADKNIKNDNGNTPIISAIFEQEMAVIDF
jgi:ankyrin repeat protein